ncbi:MAG: bifunctional glutamate N-acetyltransferase/amino-acid acetyltransferase ArgJ [Clostridia bacterium]|nr:bifunctional glutamate N-acetyltransferase/amino-acid acetyltransferase ArgJ [Clostridia bacterium]
MEIINGGVTAAKGFAATGLNVGIKNNVKKDMAMVVSESPCVAAGTFTLNKVCAAPVKWDKKVVFESDFAQAVVINSGVANACTGQEGFDNCQKLADETAKHLAIPADSVLIASTGVIGKQLPMDIMLGGISRLKSQLGSELSDGELAAEAIMTTDTVKKQVAVTFDVAGTKVTMGGMCKGSGMIHPNMATMLGFITTDLNIEKAVLQKALSSVINDTFNMISVDGDTSTNDTVLVLANKKAGNPVISSENSEGYAEFFEALTYVCKELAKKIAGDGEGATCLFEVTVINASDKEQAKILAKSIVTSSLTKAAIFGHDANWGRILCAMGYSSADFDPEKVDIYFESSAGKIKIVENGTATDYSEEEATKILSQNPVTAIADVKMGDVTATAWGCDLTFDYVKINADYRS